jgi:hypothetical protein
MQKKKPAQWRAFSISALKIVIILRLIEDNLNVL